MGSVGVEMACVMLSLSLTSLVFTSVLSESVGLYVTTEMKNMNGVWPNQDDTFLIPDGQCSGFVDQSLLCSGQDAGAVKVEVKDNVAFPSVEIHKSLLNTTIERSLGPDGRCAEEVEVKLSFYCVQGQASVRQRRSLQLLPTAPAT